MPSANDSGPCSPSVEEPAMVSQAAGNGDGLPSPTPSQREPHHPDTPGVCAGSDTTTSHLAYLWRQYQDKQILEEGSELLLASRRQKSSKSYDSHFHK